MEYSRNFEVGMKIVNKVFSVLGINIFDLKYRPNWRTICSISLALFGNINIFYTLFYHRKNFVMTLRCLCAAPEAFQGVVKLYTIKKHGKMMVSTIDFIRLVYQQNAEGGPDRIQSLRNCSNNLVSCVKKVVVILISILLVVTFYPVYSMLYLEKRELFFEIIIIGYPPRTLADYIINWIVQLIETVFAFGGNNACDLLLCMLVIHLSLLIGIFETALKETESLIGSKDHDLRKLLRNCMLMHQDLIKYISCVNNIYATTFFCQTATASVSLALNCFCIVKTDWLGAYGFGLFALMKIFMFCILGTFVEIMSDKIVNMISKFSWYLLPVDCQKMIFLALRRSQSFTELMIADTKPLNVSTGTEIMKAIYSYLMMLLNIEE